MQGKCSREHECFFTDRYHMVLHTVAQGDVAPVTKPRNAPFKTLKKSNPNSLMDRLHRSSRFWPFLQNICLKRAVHIDEHVNALEESGLQGLSQQGPCMGSLLKKNTALHDYNRAAECGRPEGGETNKSMGKRLHRNPAGPCEAARCWRVRQRSRPDGPGRRLSRKQLPGNYCECTWMT